jgi:hypothetical protein
VPPCIAALLDITADDFFAHDHADRRGEPMLPSGGGYAPMLPSGGGYVARDDLVSPQLAAPLGVA